MSRNLVSLLAGAALLALAACDDAAAPKGEPGDLTVRAYVDRDATGTFTTGDLAIQGLAVTATPVSEGGSSDGTPVTVNTDGTGTATFADLEPGSYRITYDQSTAPQGAVLTTNPTPTVAISFQGTASATPEFRYVFQPATLSGRIYRENGTNTTYDAGVDTPGPGLKVWIRADTGNATIPGARIDSTTTDAEGAYSFARLAPGTYFVEFENPGTIDYGNMAMQRVTLQPAITTTALARFTGSLIMTVAEARAAAIGSRVAIVGNITTPPGSFTSSAGANSEIWVQDATGGIAVFSVLSTRAAELPLGQRVQVVGTRGENFGQIQITTPNLTVTPQTGSTIIAPRTVTGAQLNARTFDGQLGRITGVTVDSIGTTTSTSFTVFGKDPSGQSVQVRVIGNTGTVTNTGLTRTNFVTGQRYDITGQLTTNLSGTAPNQVANAQIKPRFASDVVLAPVTPPAGGIIINEVMANPATTVDAAGEYIELYNAGTTAQDLTGYIIIDFNGTTGAINGIDTIGVTTATPTPLVIQPGQYVLLSHSSTVTTATLVPDYRYRSTIQLNNSGTQPIVLRNPANVTIDSVSVVGPLGMTAGIARGVIDPTAENTDVSGSNWVDQTTVYATNPATTPTTDKGTPKARNDGAIIPTAPARIIINEVMANPATTIDAAGEYVELYNAGGTALDLKGWILIDFSSAGVINGIDTLGVTTAMESLVIQPGQYMLLSHASSVNAPNFLPIYRYRSTIQLNNSGTQPIVLRNPSNVTMDSVSVVGPLGMTAGIARGVIDPTVDNTDVSGANWADQTSVYATNAATTPTTDKGTPGIRNDGAVNATSATLSTPAASRTTVAPARKPKATVAAPRR